MAAHKGTGSTLNLVGPKVDLDSVAGRKVESRVDVKKLEKVATLRREQSIDESRQSGRSVQNGRRERILLDEPHTSHLN